MGKKGSWFAVVKSIFKLNSKDSAKVKAFVIQYDNDKEVGEIVTNSKAKKCKDKGRWSFGRSKHVQSPEMMKSSNLERRVSINTDEEQDKHALAVAAASAAAAEAAVAAAYAAAEVVRLTGGSQSPSMVSLNQQQRMAGARHSSAVRLTREDWAAIKIQTAFRGYLARRALRALRGLVRLQALVRGHAVRKQATRTFRCMQALVRVQARARAMHSKISEEEVLHWEPLQKHKQELHDQQKGQLGDTELASWDDSVQSVDEKVARRLNKKEATLKRERALAYALAHQSWNCPPQHASVCADDDSDKLHWGWTWLERWMAARSWEAPQFDNYASELIMDRTKLDPPATESGTPRKSMTKSSVVSKQGSGKAFEQVPVDCLPMTMTPQRQSFVMSSCNIEEGSLLSTGGSASSAWSFGSKFRGSRNGRAVSSIADADSLVSSPRVPNYMSTTHSAKAKARSRSHSTPKQRTSTPERERIALSSARKRLSFPTTEGSVASAKSTPRHPRALGLAERSPSLKCFPVCVEAESYVTSYA